MANPSVRLVKHFSGRKFEAFSPRHVVNDGQCGTVGSPVRVFDIFHDLARRSSAERHAGESTAIGKAFAGPSLECQSHLSGGRNRQNVSSRRVQFPRLGTFRPGAEQADRLAFPGCTVDHGLAVRREAGRVDDSAPKR